MIKVATMWLTAIALVAGSLYLAYTSPEPVAAATTMAGDTVLIETEMSVGGGTGSGVHIGQGYILTVAHVVAPNITGEAAEGVTVTEIDVTTDLPNAKHQVAEVLWANKDYDVALLKIKDWQNIKSAKLAVREPVVGEEIEVVGNPMWFRFAHTWGRVATGIYRMDDFPIGQKWFGANVVVEPGNSGGPVFDKDHKVLGLADMIPNYHKSPLTGLSAIVPSLVIVHLLPTV